MRVNEEEVKDAIFWLMRQTKLSSLFLSVPSFQLTVTFSVNLQ